MESLLQSCLFLLMLNNLLMLGTTRLMWLIRLTAFQGTRGSVCAPACMWP